MLEQQHKLRKMKALSCGPMALESSVYQAEFDALEFKTQSPKAKNAGQLS